MQVRLAASECDAGVYVKDEAHPLFALHRPATVCAPVELRCACKLKNYSRKLFFIFSNPTPTLNVSFRRRKKNDFTGSLQKVKRLTPGHWCMTSERKQRSLNLAHQMRTYRFWAAKGLVSLRRGTVSDDKALPQPQIGRAHV